MSAQPAIDFNADPLFPLTGFIAVWRNGDRMRSAKLATPTREAKVWDLGDAADLANHAILCREYQHGTCWAYVDLQLTGRKITAMPLSAGDGVRCRLTFQPTSEERETVEAWVFPVADGKDEWTTYDDLVPYAARWRDVFGTTPKPKWS